MKKTIFLGLSILLQLVYIAPKVFSTETAEKIEWNSKNKAHARKIHELTASIYTGDLEPVKMINDLEELENLLVDSAFSNISGMDDFQVVARAIYAWRTTNVELLESVTKQRVNATENEIGLSLDTAVRGSLRTLNEEMNSNSKTESSKTKSDGYKIKDLREVWSHIYRLLLTTLKERGFPPPIHKSDIVGVWTWRGSNAEFTFTLNQDDTMVAKIKPDNPNDWPGKGWVNKGEGKWSLDYNHLKIQMDSVKLGLFGKDHEVIWIDDRIEYSLYSTIVLDRKNCNELKRHPTLEAEGQQKPK